MKTPFPSSRKMPRDFSPPDRRRLRRRVKNLTKAKTTQKLAEQLQKILFTLLDYVELSDAAVTEDIEHWRDSGTYHLAQGTALAARVGRPRAGEADPRPMGPSLRALLESAAIGERH